MKYDQKIQLIIVGESTVGKTSLLYKYTQNLFTNQHLATVGLEYFTKDEKINDKAIRVKIWDTAGQEQYKSLTRNFFRNSDGVIIVYDVTNKSTFEKVKEWVQSIMDNTEREKNIKMVLVGNKVDLIREVTKEEGKKIAEYFKIPFFETSAKENIGISDFMRKIICDVSEDLKPRTHIKLSESWNNKSDDEKCKC